MKGETEKFPFGFIRPVRAPGASKTAVDISQIQLHLTVFALNYPDFLELMKSLDDFTQYQLSKKQSETAQYLKMKWKHSFDAYKQNLPPYYNDYINSCLKFVDSVQRTAAAKGKAHELPS